MVFLGLTYIMSTGPPHSEYQRPAKVGDDIYTQKSYGSTSSGSSSTGSSGESHSGSTSGHTTDYTKHTEESEHSEHSEQSEESTEKTPSSGISESILKGGSIAPKLENATAKYGTPFPHPLSKSHTH